MPTLLVRARSLPDAPLDAASAFFAEIAPELRAERNRDVVISFVPASHAHDAWRLAAVQELAREFAPEARVNAIVAADDRAEAAQATLEYLANAPGVTGQVLEVADASD